MDGLVLIDKPQEFTSFDVVAVMRKTLGQRKIGHTGTLDPMATGVLPLLVGKAAKLCDLLPVSDKEYLTTIRLGVVTDTLDIWGNILQTRFVNVTQEDISNAVSRFVGDIQQTPPMYSAVSQNGKRLYEMARQGIEVQRPKRSVIIHSADIVGYNLENNEFSLKVRCSKGTYIRTLADDIGQVLGTGAVISSLRRTSACGFSIDRCVELQTAKAMTPEQLVLPINEAIIGYDKISVSSAQAIRFSNGGALSLDRLKIKKHIDQFTPYIRVFSSEDTLLGLGYINNEEKTLKTKCLF